jgi:Acetyl xylan esterase (AXE1)
MRLLVSAAALLISSLAVASAQTPPPAASARPTAPSMARPDPANAGRIQLYTYLDDIAARQTAARRATIAKITTRGEAEVRQQQIRVKLLDLLGGNFENTPLNPRILGSTQLDGFRIEKILYDSQPNFPVTALLYIPDNKVPATQSPGAPSFAPSAKGGIRKLPAIVMAPGHSATGNASDFALASTFARNGFAVLSYDPIGQGERLQYPDPAHPGHSLATQSTGEHAESGLQPTLIGDAIARYFAWDGIRAVDYLISRPEIDAERIGAFGCSGGGAMTALLAAADRRVHAIATGCYITSFDALLPILGPQDAEQSIPNFIASGFDFADWIELAAPRPYAIVATVADMFPWAGVLTTATEARRFYSLFDPTAAGTPTALSSRSVPLLSSRSAAEGSASVSAPSVLPTPTGPTLNSDTSNSIPATAPFQLIAGIGGHGNLRPLTAQIVSFFLVNLAHSTAPPIVPPPPGGVILSGARSAQSKDPEGSRPATAASTLQPQSAPSNSAVASNLPAGALQVTPTGQVATSYPGSATVLSLNLKRAALKRALYATPLTLQQLQTAIRIVTRADAAPGSPSPSSTPTAPEDPDHIRHRLRITTDPGIIVDAEFYRPTSEGKHPTLLILRDSLDPSLESQRADDIQHLRAQAQAGTAVFVLAPRPSPPGTEATKSPILGPFYMTELRAELTGKTLLGMRVDDVIRAIDFFSTGYTEDPNNITALASGHMGLVLLHAAVLDPRLKQITIDHTLESYASLLNAPMPLDAPQDILPGVLLKYDIPDLVRILGPRLTFTDPLPGTANLSQPQAAATGQHP